MDWKFLASIFPNITSEQSQYKWQALQKSNAQREEWTPEEDLILSKLVE